MKNYSTYLKQAIKAMKHFDKFVEQDSNSSKTVNYDAGKHETVTDYSVFTYHGLHAISHFTVTEKVIGSNILEISVNFELDNCGNKHGFSLEMDLETGEISMNRLRGVFNKYSAAEAFSYCKHVLEFLNGING